MNDDLKAKKNDNNHHHHHRNYLNEMRHLIIIKLKTKIFPKNKNKIVHLSFIHSGGEVKKIDCNDLVVSCFVFFV